MQTLWTRVLYIYIYICEAIPLYHTLWWITSSGVEYSTTFHSMSVICVRKCYMIDYLPIFIFKNCRHPLYMRMHIAYNTNLFLFFFVYIDNDISGTICFFALIYKTRFEYGKLSTGAHENKIWIRKKLWICNAWHLILLCNYYTKLKRFL